jgi:non-heme chloroperoxidase
MSRFDVESGKSVYYEHYSGTAAPVVLVHGWGMSVRIWDLTLPALLEANHEVVSLDHRGCGLSDKDFAHVTIDAIAGDVVNLISAVGLERPIVVGWSLGAAVTARVAIELGSALGGIVLIGPPTPRYLQADDFPHGATADALDQTRIALRDTRPAFLRVLSQSVLHQDLGTAYEQWMWDIFMQTSPSADAALFDLGEIDHRAELRSVEIPALVCSGDHDVVVDPAIAQQAVETLPNARLLRFADSGHAPFLDERDKLNAALLEFVANPGRAIAAS